MKRFLKGASRLASAVGFFIGVALVPTVGIVLLPAAALWFAIRRPEPGTAIKRRRRAALERAITLHLLAHRLDNTPANRARVLEALHGPGARGGAR
jgi:hypothetical protein